MPAARQQQYLLWGSLILLALVSGFAFSRNAGYLFAYGDGLVVLIRLAEPRSLTTAIGVPANMLEGLGDMAAANYAFEPSYRLALLVFGSESVYTEQFQVFVNTVLALEIFLSTFVAARSFGFDRSVSLIAAWTSPLLIMPYFEWAVFYPLLQFSPHLATTISENLLILAAFASLGRPLKNGKTSAWKDGMLSAAIALLMAHMSIGNPVGWVLWLPVQMLLGVGILLGTRSLGEVRSKIMWCGAAYLACFGVLGLFIYGQVAYSTTRYWTAELENHVVLWQLVSTWFRPADDRCKFAIGATLVGLLLALTDKRHRHLAIPVLAFMPLLLGIGLLIINFDFWRGPAPAYLEVFIAPVYAMFIAYAVVRAGTIVRDAVVRYRPSATLAPRHFEIVGSTVAILAISVAIVAGSLHTNKVPRIYGPSPPTRPPLVSLLADKVAISPGSAFQGRVASMLLQNRTEAASWADLVGINLPRAQRGNDHYWSGLWPFRIPTLFEYSQFMSPAYFRTAVQLWGRPGDQQVRNVIVLRRADAKTFALFGVRFVISDAAMPAPFRLEATDKSSASETLHLYEVPDVNLGGYSPTEVTKAATFKDALDAVSAPDFDARRTAVVFDVKDDLKQKLVPASDVRIRFDSDALEINASSSGYSLLVLPFEFSHCLEVTSKLADLPEPAIFRVDGPLTGLVFKERLSARIQYFTSPFTRPGCRLKDVDEFSSLLRH